MILKFGVSNFLSFNDYVELSMLTTRTKVKGRFPDNYNVLKSGYDVNKTAVIIGENAGGKSNFVSSIRFFKSYFAENEAVSSYPLSININNYVSRCPKHGNTSQRFYLELSDKDNGIFIYNLIIDAWCIVEEELRYKASKEGREKLIIKVSRVSMESSCDETDCDEKNCISEDKIRYKIVVNDSEIPEESKKKFEKVSKQNELLGLFVTKIALLGSEKAIRFVSIVKNDICPETYNVNYDLYKSVRKEQHDIEIINDERFLEIFRIVDHSIVDIEIDAEDPFKKTKILRKRKDGSTFTRELYRDSSGVREYFAWAIQLFKVVYENKIVIADEMDRVLNPILSDRIVSFINGKDHLGQFIFTSHNVLHLDLKTYMKEQIYFITKDVESLESEMYSLAEFPEIRYETSKVYEFYLKGILGGTASE